MSILRSSDLTQDSLSALIAQEPWPKEAYIWAEWLDQAWLGRAKDLADELPRPFKDSLHTRIFWKDGELRWKRLDRGVYRVVYLGEDEQYAPTNELEDASSELQRELTRSTAFSLPEEVVASDTSEEPDEDGEPDDADDAEAEARLDAYHVELQQLSLCSKAILAEQTSQKKRLQLEVRVYKNPSNETCFERYAALRWR